MIAKCLAIFAQVFPGDTTTVVHEPENLKEIVNDPVLWFSQLGYFAGLVIFIVGLLIKLLKIGVEKKWPKVVLALVVSILLASFTNLVNWGLFADAQWLDTILGGLGMGVVAGGLVDIPTMKIILNIILSLVQFKKPTV